MALISYYNAGTATVAVNGVAVTGQGTLWVGAVKPGDLFAAAGLSERVLSVNSNTSLTLARGWPGAARTAAAYEVRVTPAPSEIVGSVRQLLVALSSGNLSALAELEGGANLLAYFTGSGAMETTALTPAARELLDDPTFSAMLETLGAQPAGEYVIGPLTATDIPNLPASKTTSGQFNASRIPADLTPDKAFRRGNILGTVSQSGGVPTGAIIERGSNANGDYVRYADGTQICWRIGFGNSTTDISSGGGIFTSVDIQWSFPSAFSSPPACAFSGLRTSAGTAAPWIGASIGADTAGAARARLLSPASNISGMISAVAIGRWF